PVVDDDAIWIGSSQGGSAGNSFRGLLDEIAIHRGIVPDDVMQARYRRVGPAPVPATKEIPPELPAIPAGRGLVTAQGGLGAHDHWPQPGEAVPAQTMRWLTSTFVFPRLPVRYDDWGIRQAWKAPVLFRAAADVQLSPGKHRLLLRARGLSRLWINGQVV